MTQIVTTPDGVEHEFPDETTDDVIKKTLKDYSAQADATARANAAAGSRNEETGQTASGFGGMVKEAVRGAGEGLANIVDTPWTVGQALQHSGAESQFSTGETPPAIVEPPSTGHLRRSGFAGRRRLQLRTAAGPGAPVGPQRR